jgi:hypothetical protein
MASCSNPQPVGFVWISNQGLSACDECARYPRARLEFIRQWQSRNSPELRSGTARFLHYLGGKLRL